MLNNYEIINTENWKRKEYYNVYKNAAMPMYSISFEIDVTNFQKYVKEQGFSFTMAFVYAVTKCANEIEEFRYRILKDKVVLYDSIDTSFTYLEKDTELFKVVNVPMQNTMEEYVKLATKIEKDQTVHFTGPMENDIYQFSALPWITFTHVSHTDSGKRDNAQPIFVFGKFYKKEDRYMMPFSAQVHHAFIDGIHIAKLAEKLQKYINEL